MTDCTAREAVRVAACDADASGWLTFLVVVVIVLVFALPSTVHATDRLLDLVLPDFIWGPGGFLRDTRMESWAARARDGRGGSGYDGSSGGWFDGGCGGDGGGGD